jgi:hypothetical protein
MRKVNKPPCTPIEIANATCKVVNREATVRKAFKREEFKREEFIGKDFN